MFYVLHCTLPQQADLQTYLPNYGGRLRGVVYDLTRCLISLPARVVYYAHMYWIGLQGGGVLYLRQWYIYYLRWTLNARLYTFPFVSNQPW